MAFTDMLIADILDVVGVARDGGLWHTRLSIGSGVDKWTPWENVKGVQGTANPEPFISADCAIWQDGLHICAVSQDGKLWYASPGQPFDDLSAHIGDILGGFQDVSVAEFKGNLHVCAVTQDGWVIRAICHNDGRWEPLEDVSVVAASLASYSRSFIRVDCATGSQCLHMCVVTADGKLLYTSWNDSGWTDLVDVESEFVGGNAPGDFADVSVSEENDELHFYALSQGVMWHTVGRAGPVLWQPVLDNAIASVKRVISSPDAFMAVDCAGVEWPIGYQRHVHVCGVTQDGMLWYGLNFVEPSVPLPFESVTNMIQAPGPFVSVSVANSVDVVGRTAQPLIDCGSLQKEVNTDCALIAATPDPRQKANLQQRVRTLLAVANKEHCRLTVPGGCLS
jgi:hypothetical protein